MNQNTEQSNLPSVIQTAITNQKINPENVNLILPTQTFGNILGEYDKVTIEVVKVDPNPYNGDVFEITKGKKAFGKRPLMAISNALGIIWDPKVTGIIESISTKSRAKATGIMRKPNGEWIVLSEEKTVDLEAIEDEQLMKFEEEAEKGNPYWQDGSKNYESWKTNAEKEHWINKTVRKAMLQYKKFTDERAMTEAKERVIRQFVALKNTYTDAELSKSFAFPRIILDASKMLEDPEVRQAAVDRMTGAANSIFGSSEISRKSEYSQDEHLVKGYKLLPENKPNKEDKEHDKERIQIPWETVTEEEKEIKAGLEELKRLSEIEYLHPDAKAMAKDMLAQEKPNLDAVNNLIDRINSWLKAYNAQKGAISAKAT
jgi:hypothetical protein